MHYAVKKNDYMPWGLPRTEDELEAERAAGDAMEASMGAIQAYEFNRPYGYRFSEHRPNPTWHPGGGMRIGGEYYPGSGRYHHHNRARGEYDYGGGRHYDGQWYPGGGHYESNPFFGFLSDEDEVASPYRSNPHPLDIRFWNCASCGSQTRGERLCRGCHAEYVHPGAAAAHLRARRNPGFLGLFGGDEDEVASPYRSNPAGDTRKLLKKDLKRAGIRDLGDADWGPAFATERDYRDVVQALMSQGWTHDRFGRRHGEVILAKRGRRLAKVKVSPVYNLQPHLGTFIEPVEEFHGVSPYYDRNPGFLGLFGGEEEVASPYRRNPSSRRERARAARTIRRHRRPSRSDLAAASARVIDKALSALSDRGLGLEELEELAWSMAEGAARGDDEMVEMIMDDLAESSETYNQIMVGPPSDYAPRPNPAYGYGHLPYFSPGGIRPLTVPFMS
jgi:hypothetical protein